MYPLPACYPDRAIRARDWCLVRFRPGKSMRYQERSLHHVVVSREPAACSVPS
ncbi:hypothetical protein trd_A0142 (plasmid) [Thermomicrobium roseum DSM 5159]|uniref:Uncharacterized protein n=1 Tax=Thermomicrobium roseum (strain ATCC 27502 / DSM 5159 / P-2) TaxID=309801 RepID=B9L2X8_THERP|nr:hypothetical protein trd_A0142 [Thermomicrobium roseum DSM 5159]